MPTISLVFQDTAFDIVDQSGRPWLKGLQIASALGYSDPSAINRIYARRSDEFTDEMTATVKLTDPNGDAQETRIFSLRGAHLVAMLARTKIAKAFRQWVLDILDREAPAYEVPTGPVTPEQSELLRRIILERFGRRYGSVCEAMKRYFHVPNLSSLPAIRFNEAREFILTFPLPAAPIPRPKNPALPVAASAPESQNARWVTFFDGHNAPTVLPFHCAGGTDTRWQLIFTRFNGLCVEQLPPRAFFADPATLQKLIQDPAGPIPRTLLPSIIEACVSRLR